MRLTKLHPIGGFCAETGGGVTIVFLLLFGIPLSTTHTITGAIIGAGSVKRLSAVRWGIAKILFGLGCLQFHAPRFSAPCSNFVCDPSFRNRCPILLNIAFIVTIELRIRLGPKDRKSIGPAVRDWLTVDLWQKAH